METKKLSFEQMVDIEGGSLSKRLRCGIMTAAYIAAIGGGIATVVATGGAAAPAIAALLTTTSTGLSWGATCFEAEQYTPNSLPERYNNYLTY